jgi:hypothetical protein
LHKRDRGDLPPPTGWRRSANPLVCGAALSRSGARLGKEETRMSVLIGVLITFLVVILVLYLVNMLPLDGRTKQIVQVIVIIIGVISLLKYLAVF